MYSYYGFMSRWTVWSVKHKKTIFLFTMTTTTNPTQFSHYVLPISVAQWCNDCWRKWRTFKFSRAAIIIALTSRLAWSGTNTTLQLLRKSCCRAESPALTLLRSMWLVGELDVKRTSVCVGIAVITVLYSKQVTVLCLIIVKLSQCSVYCLVDELRQGSFYPCRRKKNENWNILSGSHGRKK